MSDYCKENDTQADDFAPDEISLFTLYLANHRDDFPQINDVKFQELLKELVRLSNNEMSKGA